MKIRNSFYGFKYITKEIFIKQKEIIKRKFELESEVFAKSPQNWYKVLGNLVEMKDFREIFLEEIDHGSELNQEEKEKIQDLLFNELFVVPENLLKEQVKSYVENE